MLSLRKPIKGAFTALVLLSVGAPGVAAAPDADLWTEKPRREVALRGEHAPKELDACIPRDRCCKVCSAGQACGNTCISRKKACHKGRGCACDAAEVC